MQSWLPVLVLVLAGSLGGPREGSAATSHADRASALFASACRRLASDVHEQRQLALTELQDAARLDPMRSDIALKLGRLYLEADLLTRARDVARRLTELDSTNASAWSLEGEVWRRYWLGTIDAVARDHAVVCLARSARLGPSEPKTWRLLAPMLVDQGEYDAAYAAAVFGARAAPHDPEAQVLLAAAAQRVGNLDVAERWFRAGVPRLPAGERERFEDIGPLLPPGPAEQFASLAGAARTRFAERFWADTDPDPVSVENEARLEYWARVTQALQLYGTSRRDEWDMRAQYYVRFGPPGAEELNPIIRPVWLHVGDWLTWTYPDLGLRVWMGSASGIHGFSEGVSGWATFARAFPDSLARRGDLVPLSGGWAVLHVLPPGMTQVATGLTVARFQSADGAHLFGQTEALAAPSDALTAEWVVLDSTGTEVTRGAQPMAASACGADQARAASFTAALAPGRYSVGVQVSDTLGHRGVARRKVVTAPISTELALSDLVVVCGSPSQSVAQGSSVRLEPETGLLPAGGDQLHAYFEIYNLTPSPGGDARFVYDCVVRQVFHDGRGWLSQLLARHEEPPPIQVSRAETTVGTLRRQFLSMQVGALPAGTYEISVFVRDVSSGATAKAVASFERRL